MLIVFHHIVVGRRACFEHAGLVVVAHEKIVCVLDTAGFLQVQQLSCLAEGGHTVGGFVRQPKAANLARLH